MKKRTRGKVRLEATLNTVATPLFLLDARRTIVFFNRGLEQLTGWQAEEVLGCVCDYASEADPAKIESLTRSLSPPPEVLAGRPASVPTHLAHRTGNAVRRLLNFFPLSDDEGKIDGILGLITLIEQPLKSQAATSSQELHAEVSALRILLQQRFAVDTLVCRSEAMIRVLEQIHLARTSKATVLIEGETGTGKEHIARLIHYQSETRDRAFVPLDCRRLPALELKLTLRRMLKGQLDLDETESPPSLQPGTVYLSNVERLPRDLQEMIVQSFQADRPEVADQPGTVPVSATSGDEIPFARIRTRSTANPRSPEWRLMASSTADLRQSVEKDVIRRDFYYLVTTLHIELPPLRRRGEDLAPLAQFLLEELNQDDKKQAGGFSEDVWEQFREYNWPGNVDELMAVVEEARTAGNDELIQVTDLPFRFQTGMEAQAVGPKIQPRVLPLDAFLAKVETEQIQLALEQSRHNKSKAAKLLGFTRPRLYRRMQALGIEDLDEKT